MSRIVLGLVVLQCLAGVSSFGQVSGLHSSERAMAKGNPAELPLTIYILYFDQSSPQLRPGVKTTLDSIARQLVQQPAWLATITGYTDNIGKRELNLVLAKHRAKTVAEYLKQQGVPTDQVIARWEGPDTKASVEGAEIAKTISRRVIVQLSPR